MEYALLLYLSVDGDHNERYKFLREFSEWPSALQSVADHAALYRVNWLPLQNRCRLLNNLFIDVIKGEETSDLNRQELYADLIRYYSQLLRPNPDQISTDVSASAVSLGEAREIQRFYSELIYSKYTTDELHAIDAPFRVNDYCANETHFFKSYRYAKFVHGSAAKSSGASDKYYSINVLGEGSCELRLLAQNAKSNHAGDYVAALRKASTERRVYYDGKLGYGALLPVLDKHHFCNYAGLCQFEPTGAKTAAGTGAEAIRYVDRLIAFYAKTLLPVPAPSSVPVATASPPEEDAWEPFQFNPLNIQFEDRERSENETIAFAHSFLLYCQSTAHEVAPCPQRLPPQ